MLREFTRLRPFGHFQREKHSFDFDTRVCHYCFDSVECIACCDVGICGEPTELAKHFAFELSSLSAPMREVRMNHQRFMHFSGINAGDIETNFEQALASTSRGTPNFHDMITRLPIETRPSHGFRDFQISAADHVGGAMNGQYTSRPTTWSIDGIVKSNPPLVRFDCDHIENFFTTLGNNIDGGNRDARKLLLPSVRDGRDVELVFIGWTRLVSVPTRDRRIAMPKMDGVPAMWLCDFVAYGSS